MTTANQAPKHHRAGDETLREFGSLVARRRQERGCTSRELAKLLDMSHSCLSRIENGQREIRLDVLRRLCALLGLEAVVIKYLRTGKF